MNICKFTPPEETCCFTGHRKIPPAELTELTARLDTVVRELYERGMRSFRCGGAVGFDTMAATAVLRCRRELPDVRLVLVLPCQDQALRWSAGDRRVYEAIRARADEFVYSGITYSRENLLSRDRALVDGCGVCVAYLNSSSGGTAYTVRYAKSSGVEVINLGKYTV